MTSPSLLHRCFAEALGTFLLVFFGCGSVHAAVLAGAQSGLWQMAVVWGVGIMVASYVVGGISGAHINPAITLTMWSWRGFPTLWVLPYLLGQFVGACLAAASLLVLYEPCLDQREKDLLLVRGQPGSEMTAMCYGEYFPNPGRLETEWRRQFVQSGVSSQDSERAAFLAEQQRFTRLPVAFLAEFLGTLILALAVFAVTDPQNPAAPPNRLGPVFIGLTVAILISVIAPLTQACFNPARDFGPRTIAWLAGWNEIAWPGPAGWNGTLLVYGLAPVLGAWAGGGVFQVLLRPAFPPLETTP